MRRVNIFFRGSILDVRTIGEIGANFSLQLSSRTRFDKFNKKKLSPKINVKNIKNQV